MIEDGGATDDGIEIDGESVQNIVIIGRCVEQQNENMRTVYTITDNTAYFKIIFYGNG